MLMIAVTLLAAASARAERLDLATIKCKDFLVSSKEHVELTLMWLDGYYSEENASPIIDFDKVNQAGSKIREYCSKNPNDDLITAADAVLGK